MGGLSPSTFKSGGASAPPAPPISPPLYNSKVIVVGVMQQNSLTSVIDATTDTKVYD